MTKPLLLSMIGSSAEKILLVSGSPNNVTSDLLVWLASEVSTIVACDSGCELCLNAGVTPDIAVGDFDSIPPEFEKKLIELGVTLEKCHWHKNETDLKLALDLIGQRWPDATILITNSAGGRPDHAFMTLGLLCKFSHLKPIIVEDDHIGFILSRAGRQEIVCTAEARNKTMSVLAMEPHTLVTLRGLEWSSEHKPFEIHPWDDVGVSNIVRSGDAAVRVVKGTAIIYIMEEYDEKSL